MYRRGLRWATERGLCRVPSRLRLRKRAVVDQCHSAVCGAEGFCVVENRPDGTTCDDNNACTENDVCTGGVCAGTPVAGCVPCQTTTECPADQQCQDGRCVVVMTPCTGDPTTVCCPPS